MEIIATIRRIDEKYDLLKMIERCILNNINIFRINLAKSTDFNKTSDDVKLIRKEFGHSDVKIMLDIPYPGCKIRVELDKPLEIRRMNKYLFACKNSRFNNLNNKENIIVLNNIYTDLDLKIGEEIIYNDGEGLFVVNRKINSDLYEFIALSNFLLYNGKSLSCYYNISNQYDLSWIRNIDPEYLALSFIDNSQQINTVKQTSLFKDSKIIAKIETQSAINHLNSILECCDGIIVARGDLAINIKEKNFLHTQKHICETALAKNKIFYISTDIMQSMITHPFPSRSDLTDLGFIKNMNPNGIILSLQLSTSDNLELAVKWINA